MDEKIKKKLDLLELALSKLKNMDHEMQTLIQQLAELQMGLSNESENDLSEKLNDILSDVSNAQKKITAQLENIEIKVNQLRNQ